MIQAQIFPSKAALCCLWSVWTFALFLLGCAAPENSADPRLYEATFATEPPTTVLAERSSDTWVIRNGNERILMRKMGRGCMLSLSLVEVGSVNGRTSNGQALGPILSVQEITRFCQPFSTQKTALLWPMNQNSIKLGRRLKVCC